jgi:hypothetical protein
MERRLSFCSTPKSVSRKRSDGKTLFSLGQKVEKSGQKGQFAFFCDFSGKRLRFIQKNS